MLAASVVRRFSASSLIAVAVMALTGLLNGIFMVGSFRALLTSAYGQVLVCKLILFFAMIGFGAWNLFLLKPRIAVDLPTVNIARTKECRPFTASKRPLGDWLGYFSNPYCWIAWNHSATNALTALARAVIPRDGQDFARAGWRLRPQPWLPPFQVLGFSRSRDRHQSTGGCVRAWSLQSLSICGSTK